MDNCVQRYSQNLSGCPDIFKKRALILFHDGFLFQFNGEKCKFYLCWCSGLTNEDINKIREISHSLTLQLGDFLGRDYLEINWNEFTLIDRILTTVLQLGHSFTTINEFELAYRHATDREFSFSRMEEKFINWIQKYVNAPSGSDAGFLSYLLETKSRLLDEWNWNTQEGKELCWALRKIKYGYDRPYTQTELLGNYRLWDEFQNYDPKTLMDLPLQTLPIEQMESMNIDDDPIKSFESNPHLYPHLCLSCNSNKPGVTFYPCNHVVVCRNCINFKHELIQKCLKCDVKIELFA